MIALGHSSVGAIIGVTVVQIAPGLPLAVSLGITFSAGVLSHYIFDWLPHGHYHILFKKMTLGMLLIGLVDFLGFILLLLGLSWWQFGFGPELWLIAAGIAGAQAPDLWEIAVSLEIIPRGRWVRLHRHWHHKVLHWHNLAGSQPHIRIARPLNGSDIWQVCVFVIAVYLVAS